jgi:acetyl-CoA acyltransferase
MSRDAVIVDAVRTPIGKRRGALAAIHPADLSAHVLRALADRTGLDPAVIDDVIWGCVSQIGEQTFDIARTAVLSAGWPESVPGVTVDRQCGSSQQAVHFAAAGLVAGHYDVVVAGGVESMSRVPMFSAVSDASYPLGAEYVARYGPAFPDQGVGAEQIAADWDLSRTRLDEFSLRSHELAARATEGGHFKGEIVPIDLPDGESFAIDEGIRRDGTLELLATLKPAFAADGKITAANSSQISDGAATLLLTTSNRARALGLEPLARIHSVAIAGDAPMPMLTAPIPATRKLLHRAGLNLADVGVYEVNEAFAPVALAWTDELGANEMRSNPNGGAIALGHPLGASGARLMTTLVHHMHERNIRYGLQTMCEAGGQANATLLELVDRQMCLGGNGVICQ